MSSASTSTVAFPRHASADGKKKKAARKRRATLEAGMRVGAWRVESELGRGGMGSVYAVTHNGFGKRAALKLCHKSVLGPEFTCEMFLREARVVHLVEHPGVVDVFATGSYDGRPYLAMERLIGSTLGARMDSKPLHRREAIGVLIELCEILEAAHQVGVVHRDLKLDNVFLLDTPGEGGRHVKLLDWGVAAVVGEPDPLQGMVAGTLTYVAPEQLRGESITPAADVYSLGVLAYQLLCHEPPFASPSDAKLIEMHKSATPPRPSKLWDEVPPALDVFLPEMLSKQAADRPAIEDVLALLRAVQSMLPAQDAPRPGVANALAALPTRPPVDVFGRPSPLTAVVRSSLVRAGVALAAIAASAAALLGA
jgi:serine/threonine-protein kinase